jgi:hypothetical protein
MGEQKGQEEKIYLDKNFYPIHQNRSIQISFLIEIPSFDHSKGDLANPCQKIITKLIFKK